MDDLLHDPRGRQLRPLLPCLEKGAARAQEQHGVQGLPRDPRSGHAADHRESHRCDGHEARRGLPLRELPGRLALDDGLRLSRLRPVARFLEGRFDDAHDQRRLRRLDGQWRQSLARRPARQERLGRCPSETQPAPRHPCAHERHRGRRRHPAARRAVLLPLHPLHRPLGAAPDLRRHRRLRRPWHQHHHPRQRRPRLRYSRRHLQLRRPL